MVAKGKRAITLQMDVPRSLKWTFSAVDSFEQLAKIELVNQKLIKEDARVEAEAVISNFLSNKQILKLAFACALEGSKSDEPDIDQASKAMDGLIENGGDLQDLTRAIQESFFLVVRPSQAASLKKSWPVFDELQEIQNEKAILDAREEMKKAKDLIKTFGGKKSKELVSSSSDSSPETSGA